MADHIKMIPNPVSGVMDMVNEPDNTGGGTPGTRSAVAGTFPSTTP